MRIRLIALFVFGVGGIVALLPCSWALPSLDSTGVALWPIIPSIPIAAAVAGVVLARDVLRERSWKWFAAILPIFGALLLPIAAYAVARAFGLPSPKSYTSLGLLIALWSLLFLPVTVPISIAASAVFRDMAAPAAKQENR